MTDPRQACDAARAIGAAALGRDPGPMAATESSSHHVYVGSDVVVKIIDADGHSRLDREIALAPCLPAAGPRCSPRLRTSPPGTGTESFPAISSTA